MPENSVHANVETCTEEKGSRASLAFPSFALLLCAGAATTLVLAGSTPQVKNLSLTFASIMLEAMPFMLLGSVAGGLLEEFVSRERMLSLIPRNPWLAACAAAGMGIVFPVCECAVVPIVRRLAMKGLPFTACVAYLLGAPIVNPVVAASTAIAYGMDFRIAALRIALGYLTAVGAGVIAGKLFAKGSPFLPGLLIVEKGHGHVHEEGCHCCHHHHHEASKPSLSARLFRALRHAAEDFLSVAHYLVIGALIAALAETFVERRAFVALASWPLLNSMVMMLLAFLLNLCSEADAFVAASFNGLMPLASQMAFMLIGPILDLKLMLMYQTLFKRKAILCIALLAASLTFLAVLALTLWGGLAR